MSVRRILLALGAFVLAVGVGVFASASLDEETTTRVLPSSGPPLPVLDPLDEAPDASEPTGDDGGAREGEDAQGSSGGGSAGDGSTAGGGSGADAASTIDDVATVAEYEVDGAPALRFLDPCASRGRTCDGVASTVLGIFAARPLEIRAVYGGSCHPPGEAERMPIGFPITIYSSNPADFELTLTGQDDPSVVRTARASTGPAAIAAWDTTSGRSPATTCAGVLLPNRTAEYDVSVTATDRDETVTYDTTLRYEATGGRPPVQVILPSIPHEDELHVVVPAKGPPRGSVAVRLFTENTFGAGSSCRTGGPTPRAVETAPVGEAELGAADYPFDLAWDHRYEHTFTAADFSAGTPFYLCIFWYDRDGAVEESEAFPVTPPNRYRAVLRVTRVDFTDHRGIPSEYLVTTLGGRCNVRLPGDEPVTGVRFEPAPGEDTRTFTAMHAPPGSCHHESPLATMPGTAYALPELDPMLRVEVSRDGVGASAAYLRLPLSSCPASGSPCRSGSGTDAFDQSFEVELPERAGTVTIRARLSEEDGRAGGRFWEIGAPVRLS